MFSKFSKAMSKILGSPIVFFFAVLMIIIWFMLGPVFKFSDAWQLVINTTTTIITFLMVFLLQNTQNRDTIALHLKLDEIIRAMSTTHNALLKIEQLSDEELEHLYKSYAVLASEVKKKMENGEGDIGVIEIPDKK